MTEVPPHPDPADGGGVLPLWIHDDGRGRFGPLTDLAPAFDLPAGGRTLRERAEGRLGRAASALLVPPHLSALAAEREAGGAAVNPPAGDVGGARCCWSTAAGTGSTAGSRSGC